MNRTIPFPALCLAAALWGTAPGRAAAPPPASQPAHPVIRPAERHRDVFHRADMPELPTRSPSPFAPVGLRYGGGARDIAFFLFDASRRGEAFPDRVYLWIPDHPEFGTPRVFRGRRRAEDNLMGFRDIRFQSEDAGVRREMSVNIVKYPGNTGGLYFEVTAGAVFEGKRTVMTYGQKPVHPTMAGGGSRVRIFSLFGEPMLQIRAVGDGTEISCNLILGEDWYLLPREGMDTAMTVELLDSDGRQVSTHSIPAPASSYIDHFSWKLRLRQLRRNERYRLVARIHLGPWFGDLTAETATQWVERGR